MPQDIRNELGQPPSPTPPPAFDPNSAKDAEKLVDTVKDVLDKQEKLQKQNDKIFKKGKDQQKQTEKFIKTLDKEVDSIKEKNKALDALNKAAEENIDLQKKMNKEAAAHSDTGPDFTSLIKSTSIVKSIGAALKKGVTEEVEEATRNLKGNAGSWAAVGVAAIYATKQVSEYVERVKTGAINFAKFRKEQGKIARSTLVAPGGVKQLQEVQESLKQSDTQFQEFLDIAKEAPFSNAAEKLGEAALKLKEAFGGDQNKRLREYVDLLKEIPTIDTDLTITATTDDTAAAYFDLAEKGKVSTVIDLQTAGLTGGEGGGPPTDDQAKKDTDLLTTSQNTEAILEDIEKTLANFLPNSLIALTGIGTAVLGLGAGVFEAFVIAKATKEIATFAGHPHDHPSEPKIEKNTRETIGAINKLSGKNLVAGARPSGPNLVASGAGALKGGLKGGLKTIAAGAATDALAGPLVEAFKDAVGAGGGGFKSDAIDTGIAELESKLVGNFGKLGQITETGFKGLKNVFSSPLDVVTKGVKAGKGALGAADKGLVSLVGKGAGLVKGLGLSVVAAAAEYASEKLFDYGKAQVDGAKDLRESLGDSATAAQKASISNDILVGSTEKAVGSLGKFGASIAGFAILGSSFGPIGTAVGAVGAALYGLPDFLTSFGSSLEDVDKELKPGLLKTAAEFLIVGPVLSSFGVTLGDVGKGMKTLGSGVQDTYDSIKSLATGIDVNVFRDQRKAQEEAIIATKALSVAEKKYRDEAVKIQKAQQKSALGLQLHFQQIDNAAKTGAVRLFEFNTQLANLKLSVFETVGGNLEDFNAAITSSTENLVKGFDKLIATLQITAKEIIEDSSLSANDRKEALDKLNEKELEATKKFSEGILHTVDQIGKTPAIIKNQLISGLAKKQTDFEQKRGGGDVDTVLKRLREEEVRSIESVNDAESNYATTVEANRKALDKSQEQRDKGAADAIETILTKSGANATGGIAGSDAAEPLKNAGEIIQSGLDRSGKLTETATKQLTNQMAELNKSIDEETKAFESKSTGGSKSTREQILTKKIQEATTEKVAKEKEKETAGKSGDKNARDVAGQAAKDKQEEINALQDQLAEAEKVQFEKLSTQKDFLDKLNDTDKKVLDDILGGNTTVEKLLNEKGKSAKQAAKDKTVAAHILKARKELASGELEERKAFEARVKPLQDTVSLIGSATKSTDQSVIATQSEVAALEKVLEARDKAYDNEIALLDAAEKQVTVGKDFQKAQAKREAAEKELAGAAAGGDFGSALGKFAEVAKESGKATEIQVDGLNKILASIPEQVGKITANIADNDTKLKEIAKRRDALVKGGAGENDEAVLNLDEQRNKILNNTTDQEGRLLELTKREAKARGEKVDVETAFVKSLVQGIAEIEQAGKARLNIESEINDSQLDFANTIGSSAGQIFKLQQQGLAIESAKLAVSKKALETLGSDLQDALNEPQKDQVKISQLSLAYEQKRADVIKEGYELQKKAFGAQRDAFEKLLGSAFGAIRQSVGTRKGVGTNAAIFGQNRVENKVSGLVTKGGSTSIENRQAGLAEAAGGGVGTAPTRSPVEALAAGSKLTAGTPATLGGVGAVKNAASPYSGLGVNTGTSTAGGTKEKDQTKLQQSTVDYSKQSVDIQSKLLAKQDDIIAAITSQYTVATKDFLVAKKDFTIQKKSEQQQAEILKNAEDTAKSNDISDIRQTGFLDRLPKPVEAKKDTKAIVDSATDSSSYIVDQFKNLLTGQFDKFDKVPGYSDDFKQVLQTAIQPATNITAVGGANANANAQTVNINIKTTVDVLFNDDMFTAKVRQIVTKDPDVRNALAKVFVSGS